MSLENESVFIEWESILSQEITGSSGKCSYWRKKLSCQQLHGICGGYSGMRMRKFLTYLAVGKCRPWLLFCPPQTKFFLLRTFKQKQMSKKISEDLRAKPVLCQAWASLHVETSSADLHKVGQDRPRRTGVNSSYRWQCHLSSMRRKTPRRKLCQFWLLLAASAQFLAMMSLLLLALRRGAYK